MRAQLVCRPRAGRTLTFALAAEECVLGRDREMAVALPLEGVSRRHARITWDGRFHWLEDLGSTNGTFLNGRRVRRERLRHLDVVTLGRYVDLVFALRADELAPQRSERIVHAALQGEGDEGEPYEIPAGEIILGRSSACNVVVDSPAVSKVHARIERRSKQLLIEDLGSSNGTFVNGVRSGASPLRDGDRVALGGTAVFRVVVEMAEVAAASGSRSRPDWLQLPPPDQRSRPQFGSEWRTRFEWNSGELAALAELQAGGEPRRPAPQRGSTRPVPVVSPAPTVVRAPAVAPRGVAPRPPRDASEAAGEARPVPAARPTPSAAPPPTPAAARSVTSPGAGGAASPGPGREGGAGVGMPGREDVEPSAARRGRGAEGQETGAEDVRHSGAGVLTSSAPAPVTAAPVTAPVAEVLLRGSGFELSFGETGAHQLGRATDSRLRVDHATVSRRHARLILAEDRSTVYVQDLGGANGTWVNGKIIEALSPLADGDRIRVGQVELEVAFRRG